MEELIRKLSGRYSEYEIFSDFLILSAMAIASAVNPCDDYEKRYKDTAGKYNSDELKMFTKLLALLVEEIEKDPRDVLGGLYMSMGLGSKSTGQFFTPYHICRLMARTVDFSELKATMKMTILEPSCGSGANVIACYQEAKEQGLFYPGISVTAVDLDLKAVCMAFVQFSLLGISAKVSQGNTLELKTNLTLYTPFWNEKR